MDTESPFVLAYLDEKGKAHVEQHDVATRGTLTAHEGRALIRAMIDHYFKNISTEIEHATIEESKQ